MITTSDRSHMNPSNMTRSISKLEGCLPVLYALTDTNGVLTANHKVVRADTTFRNVLDLSNKFLLSVKSDSGVRGVSYGSLLEQGVDRASKSYTKYSQLNKIADASDEGTQAARVGLVDLLWDALALRGLCQLAVAQTTEEDEDEGDDYAGQSDRGMSEDEPAEDTEESSGGDTSDSSASSDSENEAGSIGGGRSSGRRFECRLSTALGRREGRKGYCLSGDED